MLGGYDQAEKAVYAEQCRPDPEKMLQRARAEKEKFITLKAALLDAANNVHISTPQGGENYFLALVGALELRIFSAENDIKQWLAEIDKP